MINDVFPLFRQNIPHLTSCISSYQVIADTLKSCAAVTDTNLGKALHGHVIKGGHSSCQIVVKALLNMYAKCKAFEDGQKIFDEINDHDTVSWNIVLSGFARSPNHDDNVMRLFHMMHTGQNPKPSTVTLAIVLPVYARSGALDAGKNVHSYAIKSGLESNTLVGNALLSMYAKSGFILDASAVFDGIADKDIISYNAMIAGFSENKYAGNAFHLFQWISKGPVVPNYATIANILPICAGLGEVVGYKYGKEIHCNVLRRPDFENEVTVMNALLSFYLKVRRVREAESLFWRMKLRDLVSWNSVIAGYASNGEWLKAVEMFCKLVDMEVIGPDSVTLISILPACAQLQYLQMAKQIHGYVVRRRALLEDTSVGNALINFYAKCNCIEAAFWTFLLILHRDLISWNTLLDAFGQNQLQIQFVDLLCRMFRERIKPDTITILSVVQFWGNLCRMNKIKETHGFSLRCGLLFSDTEPTLENALLDAYAKCGNMDYASRTFESLSGKRNVVTCNSLISGYLNCGSLDDAHLIFQKMSERDLTTWNLMVRIYAENERLTEAIILFNELQDSGVKPDAMTIMSFLPVCTQMSSIHQLKQCHAYVLRACFEDIHLNGALLDVYSKCGSIQSAYTLYQSIREKDLVLFTAMVGGFAMHGMGDKAIAVFHQMLETGVKPDDVIITTVLSACSHAGLVNEGLMIFDSIEQVHNMKPNMEHYACVVDLLARGGRIKEAFSVVNAMPVPANANIWGTLLGACKTHHEVELGHAVADRLLNTENGDIGNYVVLSNLYAADARWDQVLEMRRLIKSKDLKKPAGCSWIEVARQKHVFIAADYSHPERILIFSILNNLDKQIKDLYEYQYI